MVDDCILHCSTFISRIAELLFPFVRIVFRLLLGAPVWVYVCGVARLYVFVLPLIHTPYDDSLPIAISVIGLPFGKINMNVRHVLCSATQHSSRCLVRLLSTFFAHTIRKNWMPLYWCFKACILLERRIVRVTFWFYSWARACFPSWQFASDKNFFFASNFNRHRKRAVQDFWNSFMRNPIGKSP